MLRMNDFKSEPEELLKAELAAADRVLRSGYYVLGPEVARFEKSFAELCGTAHCAGVANGMDAIEIGLRASGIGPGDEVITTPMTAFATTLAILRAGATPVLADIELDSGLLSLPSAARCISPRTRAVVLVHLYGHMHALGAWTDFCRSHGIQLIEDCAQAHGAKWHGKVAGSIGHFGAYSFYPTKNLGAIGDGGAVVSSDGAFDERLRILRNYGQTERYYHGELGLNSRLDELQAAILSERLAWLKIFTERRRAVANFYRSHIKQAALEALAAPAHDENHVHHLYVVRSPMRDRLAAALKDRGVEALIHYPVPVHKQKPTEGLRRDPAGLKQAEVFADSCLSLPCHPQLTQAQLEFVVDAVNTCLK